jgi:hypothetical protein
MSNIPKFALRFTMLTSYTRDPGILKAGYLAEAMFFRMIARLHELCAEGNPRARQGFLDCATVSSLCPGLRNAGAIRRRLESVGIVSHVQYSCATTAGELRGNCATAADGWSTTG